MTDRYLKAKQAAAQQVLGWLDHEVVGMGTGSTVAVLLDELAACQPGRLQRAVSSSKATTQQLQAMGVEVVSLNDIRSLPVYVDGADEVDAFGYCLKGGGGAHTQEKILAQAADQFICVADNSKWVKTLGRKAPLTLEVLEQARSAVARRCVSLGGRPVYREGWTTDQGHRLLDVYELCYDEPLALSDTINGWAGVVGHGLFAHEHADVVVIGHANGRCDMHRIA